MLAVVPIHIGSSTMVVSMHKLMSERMIHLLLTHQMIVAQYDLQTVLTVIGYLSTVSWTGAFKPLDAHPIGRSEPATCLCRAILNPEKALVHLTASLYMQ